MAVSNRRNRNFDTIHHLMNRIAHKVFFLHEDERNDFLSIVKRAACFCGIDLYGWCILDNHFHILAHLPAPRELDEMEILDRYECLKGKTARMNVEASFARFRNEGEIGKAQIAAWLDSQRRRMYDVGSFMKIVQQWFTEDYNSRNGHRGTLWESSYKDKVVKNTPQDVARVLAYINLNPIRAAICTGFAEYPWSSYTAFVKGDMTVAKGLRAIYGAEASEDEIRANHESVMAEELEEEKLLRAEEIARKRLAGWSEPADALTNEALIQQAAVHLEEIKKAEMAFRQEHAARQMMKARAKEQILRSLQLNSIKDITILAKSAGVTTRTAYRYLTELQREGHVTHDYAGAWKCQTRSHLL